MSARRRTADSLLADGRKPAFIDLAGASGAEALQPQDLVITLLGVYVRPFGDLVWSGGLVLVLGELGFSTGAARVALTRLVRRGLITRERSGRLVDYRLTSRCDRLLDEGDGRIFSFGDGDDDSGRWTVLWHQIPEDRRLQRSRLARRLRFLGFGSIQDSVWVSAHNHSEEVARLLGELDVSEYATVFVAQVGAVSGLSVLVSRAWDLGGLLVRYKAFESVFAQFLTAPAQAALTDAQAFLVRTRLVHLFRGFPQLDPEWPDEPEPLSRARARAVATFHALFDELAEPSQRHFKTLTSTPRRRVSG
jgi:phenylacetic acid degradation operon negative regulatory protein